jgi:uncharacterized protein (TIGR03790 family)
VNFLIPPQRPALLKFLVLLIASIRIAGAAERGDSVVVVYNSQVPESKGVAEHYAQRRQVPTSQIFAFDLPTTEAMTRAEFTERLQKPLLKKLTDAQLFTLGPGATIPNSPGLKSRVVNSRIRYAVLCYGVPTKILKDPTLVEPGAEKMPQELRRNEASVDADLACLPQAEQVPMWTGALNNPFYRATNAAILHPTNGILLVTRLDGPSADIARGLVDKALAAETNGLWGRAYIDARGITNGNYKLGDDWIKLCARITRQEGYDTELDTNEKTFSASFPLSHVALYVGWYDWHASGPFTRPTVEFMPGAFAYHLHSFSANTIRSTTENWVGPLLAKGATATLGCVDEPYLGGTPDVGTFMSRWLGGPFTFGEAAYAAQASLSWQTIAVGDPLYNPNKLSAEQLAKELLQRKSRLAEWFQLRIVNLNQAAGMELDDVISLLERSSMLRQSAVLTEKLGDLYWAKRKLTDSLDNYEAALKRGPSPQQKTRLLLLLAERRVSDRASYELYQQFLKEVPDYPDTLMVYKRLHALAETLSKTGDMRRWEEEIKRLTPPPPPEVAPTPQTQAKP